MDIMFGEDWDDAINNKPFATSGGTRIDYSRRFEFKKREIEHVLGDGTDARKADNMKNIKISKVEIEIGSKTIQLSLKEAKELKDVLNDTFPDESVSAPIVIERWTDRWDIIPWAESRRPYTGYPLATYCSSSGGSTLKFEGDTAKYSLSC